MKIKHTNAIPVPPLWKVLVLKYLVYLEASGYPDTTIDTRKQHLHFLARRIACDPRDLTADELLTWCAKQKWAPESRRGRHNTYRFFWKWAAHTRRLPNIAVELPKVRQTHGIARPTPESVYREALDSADIRVRLILRLACEGGLRRTEIAQLHTRDVFADFVGWSLLVRGKGNKQRVVPLPPGLAVILRDLPAGWVFPAAQHDGHVSPSWVGRLASRALSDDWTLHTLRSRFATLTYEVDHDVFAVQELLGHSSPETTRRYVSTNSQRLRRLVEVAAKDTQYQPAHSR